MSALSTLIHEQLEQKKKRRRRENKELNQMTKSQRKARTGSFENEQNLVPKDMGNDSMQLSKNKASPQEETTGSTLLAKLEKPKNC
jgi:hypothetical protein